MRIFSADGAAEPPKPAKVNTLGNGEFFHVDGKCMPIGKAEISGDSAFFASVCMCENGS